MYFDLDLIYILVILFRVLEVIIVNFLGMFYDFLG